MATATVDTEIVIRTERLMAELKKIPGIAEAEVRKMAGAVAKEWAKAEAEAEKSAKAMAAAAKKAAEKAEAEWNRGTEAIAKKVAAQFGGVSGDFLDLATDASGAIGTVGVAAAGAAAGVAVLGAAVVAGASAVVNLVGAAEEARERLHAMGVEVPMSGASIDALDQWKTTADAAAVQADMLTVQIGALTASAFLPAAEAALGLASGLGEILPTATQLTGAIENLQTGTRVFGAIVSLGITEVVRYAVGLEDLSEAGREAAEALGMQIEANKALAAHEPVAKRMLAITEEAALAETGASAARIGLWKATQALDEEYQTYARSLDTLNLSEEERALMLESTSSMIEARKEQLTEEVERAEDAAAATKAASEASKAKAAADKSAAEAARERAKSEADLKAALQATEQVESLILSTTADRIGAEEEIERAYQARLQAIEKAAASGADAAAVQEATTQAELRRQRDLADLSATRAAAAEEEAAQARKLQEDITALGATVEDSLMGPWEQAGFAVQVWGEQLQSVLDSEAVQAIGDLAGQWAESFMASNEEIIGAMEERHDRQVEQFQAERDARQEQIDEYLEGEMERIDALLEAGAISEREANAERKRILLETRERKKAAAEETKAAKEALEDKHRKQLQLAREAFNANQKLQRVQAIMEAGRAAISMIPGFAFLGPGAPVAAATAAGAALAIQLASINGQSPPEFPAGRAPLTSPDHPIVGAIRPDEAVMPGRWVAAQGGPRAVEDMIRRNEGPAGNTFNLFVDGRHVSTVRGEGDGRFSAPSWAAGKRALYGL